MEVWITEGPRVNFVMREALFEIYTWILCLSYLHEKQTSRIQSLYLYFIKIVPFWLRKVRVFFNTKHPVIILRGSLFVVTPAHAASWKIECQNFSYVYRSRKHWKCKYIAFKRWDWMQIRDFILMKMVNHCHESVNFFIVLCRQDGMRGNQRRMRWLKWATHKVRRKGIYSSHPMNKTPLYK